MNYSTEFKYINKYEMTSINQHGCRYKKLPSFKQLTVAKLSAYLNNAGDLVDLIILSDRLRVPVNYDFDSKPQVAFIKVVSAEAL